MRRWWTPEKAKPQLPTANGRDYSSYSFENLVLKGGGAKGIAYIGAAKVLDEAGILPNIKRFAGTSAGAITATLLAIRIKPEEMLEELSQKNLMDLLAWWNQSLWKWISWAKVQRSSEVAVVSCHPPVTRGWFRSLSWFPHIPGLPSWLTVDSISMAMTAITERGACEGKEFMDWFGDILDRHLARLYPLKKGLDKDITFDKPFEILRSPYTFIDGGLATNYPLWAFDGWYLSMKKEDTFQERLTVEEGQMVRRMFHPENRKERFDTRNDKTLGILLFSSSDREMYQEQIEERQKKLMEREPKLKMERKGTELYTNYRGKTDERKKAQIASIDSLRKLVGEDVRVMIETIEETILAPLPEMAGKTFSDEDIAILDAPSKEKAFEMLMIDEAGKLTTDRLRKIYDNFGPLQPLDSGLSQPRASISEDDVNRSVAIDVDYVGTMDFDMASEDMEFLMRQGAAATIAFLEEKKGRE
ncbi:hypothetical protein Bbelb_111530 [Branchiostoma belcheri]|nr:hypothetical protein Bbelb_111530 [Branchiostoma belcheri]